MEGILNRLRLDKIPIILCYLHSNLLKRLNGLNNKITRSDLKEVLCRNIIVPKKNGGIKKGVPKEYLPDIINDLIRYGLLERVDSLNFRIINNKKATARLRRFPF